MINPAHFNNLLRVLEDFQNLNLDIPQNTVNAVTLAFADEIAIAANCDDYLECLKRF